MEQSFLLSRPSALPSALDAKRLPRHVAVIPDGNLRWTKSNGFSVDKGVEQCFLVCRDIARLSNKWGIKAFTAFALSIDNLKRPKVEVDYWLEHMNNILTPDHPNSILRDGHKVRLIGDMNKLPKSLQTKISEAHEMTGDNNGLKFILPIAYGGREDVIQACRRIALDVEDGLVSAGTVDGDCVRKKMLLTEWDDEVSDPDLLIRTSGEQRLSNYLINNFVYTELLFVKKFWPDFGEEDYIKALVEFQGRNRRYGRHDT